MSKLIAISLNNRGAGTRVHDALRQPTLDMKTATIIVATIFLAGCTGREPHSERLSKSSLLRHLGATSEWGAVQGGISICLRESDAGIALVVSNDGAGVFEIDPYFADGYNIEIEAYDENKLPLTENMGPMFITRAVPEAVKLEPGDEFITNPIDSFDGNYRPPPESKWLIAAWYRNIVGTDLRGPVISGPLRLTTN